MRYEDIRQGFNKKLGYPKIMRGVGGMLSRKEARWLHRIPQVLGDGTYVDLGTHLGRSACLMADTIREYKLNAKVVTVDAFDGRALSNRFRGNANTVDRKLGMASKNFRDRGLEPYVQIMCSETCAAASSFQGECVFLFIDAGHSYACVKADFEAWNGRVTDGGLIAFHDSNLEGVKATQNEIVDWEQFDIIDTLSVWRRK